MKIILFQPEIPQNTGNIVRTCAVTGSELVLVKPLGFSTANRHLKRSGLDYWEDVSVQIIDDLFEYLKQIKNPYTFFSSKAKNLYTSINYHPDHILIFGSESKGLPTECHQRWPEQFVKLPMKPNSRCLNLATSVGISLYEAWRQNDFSLSYSHNELQK